MTPLRFETEIDGVPFGLALAKALGIPDHLTVKEMAIFADPDSEVEVQVTVTIPENQARNVLEVARHYSCFSTAHRVNVNLPGPADVGPEDFPVKANEPDFTEIKPVFTGDIIDLATVPGPFDKALTEAQLADLEAYMIQTVARLKIPPQVFCGPLQEPQPSSKEEALPKDEPNKVNFKEFL